jgi:hypothetical protein
MAGDDILKVEEVTRISIISAFNYLAYRKDKAKKEKLEYEKLQKQYR